MLHRDSLSQKLRVSTRKAWRPCDRSSPSFLLSPSFLSLSLFSPSSSSSTSTSSLLTLFNSSLLLSIVASLLPSYATRLVMH